MSWIKSNCLSCFKRDKRINNRCECSKKICSKSEVADKNIQCNFDEVADGELIENLACENG